MGGLSLCDVLSLVGRKSPRTLCFRRLAVLFVAALASGSAIAGINTMWPQNAMPGQAESIIVGTKREINAIPFNLRLVLGYCGW